MSNILSFEAKRQSKENITVDIGITVLEQTLYNVLRQGVRNGSSSKEIIGKMAELLGDSKDKDAIDAAASLTGKREHLLRNWVEILPRMMTYLKLARFDLIAGGNSLYIDDGLDTQGDQAYPTPMLMAPFTIDPNGDGKAFSAFNLSAKSLWFDGTIPDPTVGATANNPLTEPQNEGERHLNELPSVTFADEIKTNKLGFVHPDILESLLDTFILDGCASNQGVVVVEEGDIVRFSYLEVLTEDTILEWVLTVNTTIYNLHFMYHASYNHD
tara:strand:+ start:11233 stop:12045 length:813 start_codon:yes stop_codon:yes gene_type:complete